MGLFNSIRMGSSAAGEYELERSLRFADLNDEHLSRTPSSAGNRKKWTFSAWLKRGMIGSEMRIFGGNANASHIFLTSNDEITWDLAPEQSGSNFATLNTNAKFRDSAAWFHLVCALDTDEGTADNRMRMYINGKEVTSFGSRTNPSSGIATNAMNNNTLHTIGRRTSGQGSAGMTFDGYMADINFADGQQYDASYFGKTDPLTNQWVPKRFSGSYGTNGFHLDFSAFNNNTAIGTDSSGNGNNWTVNNIASSHDGLPDTPNNNFATWNPLRGYTNGVTTSDGNLRVTHGGSTHGGCPCNFGLSSGKWYAEVYIEYNGNGTQVGISGTDAAINSFPPTDGIYAGASGEVVNNGVNTYPSTPSGSWGDDDIIGLALDIPAGTIKWYKNNTLMYTRNLSDLTTGGRTGSLYFFTSVDGSSVTAGRHVLNCGQDSTFRGNKTYQGNSDDNGIGDFYYSPPSGHLAVCSANLPDPTIVDPTKHFGILTYSGNSSTQTISDTDEVDFTPDFTWVKRRNGDNSHILTDAVRGVTKYLLSASTNAEATNAIYLTAFVNGGFTSGNNGDMNVSGRTYVAWNWNAGGTTVTNTEGTKTAQVRANATAGFSIISYTGDGTSGSTVGHGLGVAPKIMFHKNRDGAANWYTITTALDGTADYLYLNLTSGASNSAVTAPTSSLVYFTSSSESNSNGSDYIMYAFAEVAGFSAIGSYLGNGDNDGQFVFTGFKPKYVLIKRTSNENWVVADTSRNSVSGRKSPADSYLLPSANNSESTGIEYDMLSNGFKFRSTSQNENGSRYIYLAFAEEPFKYARARAD